jgi:hypothetical protein
MLERNSSPRPRLGGHSSCSPEARSHIEMYKLQGRSESGLYRVLAQTHLSWKPRRSEAPQREHILDPQPAAALIWLS